MQTKTLCGPDGFNLWQGRGGPLNPYLKGVIIACLRKEMRPKDLRLIPDELFIQEKVKEFLEWSTLRGTEYLVSSRGLIQPRARSGIIAPGYPFDQPEHDITITHIHYKTLGVLDYQCVWDFIQSEGRKRS
nr:hypothetical protein CFP56_77906 [Quercus suber]